MAKPNPRPFLTAHWHNLILVNYEVDPSLVEPLVPRGAEIDFWNDKTYVSLVGFMFSDTRVLGLPIPFHRNFEEVNLRYYIRREIEGETHRAVGFVKELVPKRAIAWVARTLYNENYVAVPMSHEIVQSDSDRMVHYGWTSGGHPYTLSVRAQGPAKALVEDSHEAFIAEHYWGYAKQRDGGTIEYRVEHPPWRYWDTKDLQLTGDFAALYGEAFRRIFETPPASAFLAEGSEIVVSRGQRI